MKKQLIILSGFLGSGKTTFLCQLLARLQDVRPAVVLNDFGDIPVDGTILKRFAQGEQVVVEIGGGSVFCSCLKPVFFDTLQEMSKTEADVVIVEASGMSDPSALERMIRQSSLADQYDYALNICLFDPIKGLKLGHVLEVISRQVSAADVVIITKGDLVAEDVMRAAEDWVHSVDPEVPVVRGYDKDIAWRSLPRRLQRKMFLLGFNVPENRPDSFHVHSVDSGTLSEFLQALTSDERVLRVKGYVRVNGEFWFVSDRGMSFELQRVDSAPAPLVVICTQGASRDIHDNLKEHYTIS